MSELAKRVLFAVVAAPVAIIAFYIGDWALAALLAIVSALGAWELFRIAEHGGVRPMAGLGIAAASLLPLLVHARRLPRYAPHLGFFDNPGPAIVLGLLALLAVSIWARGVEGKPLEAAAVTAFGVAYTGGAFVFGYLLRYHPYTVPATPAAGTALLAFPVILTWASDTGAYFVGRALGRRKLIPSVSPGKTVAGAVGALVVCAIVAPAYVRLVLGPAAQLGLTVGAAVLFGVVISVAAQLGDLAESLLKREAGVKDSSRLLPGHGGILDRLDAMIFTLPVAYVLFGWLLVAGR